MNNLLTRLGSSALLMLFTMNATAGCIGPVIMGECKGTVVPFDTHSDGAQGPQAAPGFFYDKRGTAYERQNPGAVNPFTGRDAHDRNMDLYERQQRIENACAQLRAQGRYHPACN